jgi:diazepam-binding inhibitor (GABA receptor modulating acyl-CoA-binding protein)
MAGENTKEFLLAAEVVKKLKTKPSQEELLTIYGFYKQAVFGDNNNGEPGWLDFEGKKKHSEWLKHKGMANYDAEVNYITEVNSLIQKYGINS